MEPIIKGELAPGRRLLILVHGRGATAEDILSLSAHLETDDFTLMAPQAPGNTWYPFSFLSPPGQNEPHLSNALRIIDEIVGKAVLKGIPHDKIYFLGFSQGACLTLEYVARHARKWGGVIAFTGGLIGDRVNRENYSGDFEKTQIYIGTSDPDPHVPVERVKETEKVLSEMHASVIIDVFQSMGHTIVQKEIDRANEILSQ